MATPDWHKIINFLLLSNTQIELSAKTGLDQATISRIKNGKAHKGLTYNSGVALLSEYKKAVRALEVTEHG